jgi:hypothetical protein
MMTQRKNRVVIGVLTLLFHAALSRAGVFWMSRSKGESGDFTYPLIKSL